MTERSGRLPPAFERRRPRWEKSAEAAARVVSTRIERPVTVSPPDIALRALSSIVAENGEEPGILILLERGDGPHPFAIVNAQEGTTLASILLKSEEDKPADGPKAGVVDGLLVRALVADLLAVINDGFETDLRVTEDDPMSEWPFDLDTLAPRLLAVPFEFMAEASGSTKAFSLTVSFFLPADEPALTAPPDVVPINRHSSAAALFAPAVLNAVLHRRTVPLSDLGALKAGSVLPLPGARLDGLSLCLPNLEPVAQGEHGTVDGYQSVRVTQSGILAN